ncbi:CMRF35-like molecule 1 isoform X1, partial [Clarias magur]
GTDAVTTVTGYRGRSVQIKCNYNSGHKEHNKYLCRRRCPYVGWSDIPVQSGSPAKDSRFSLLDNTTAQVFTVTITDLRPGDGGTYWCGIEQAGSDKYTEILLLVKTDVPPNSTVLHNTHSSSTHSMTTSVHAENTQSTGFPTTTVIITVSVVLVLVLTALLFTIILQRKEKTRASSPGQPAQSSSALHM